MQTCNVGFQNKYEYNMKIIIIKDGLLVFISYDSTWPMPYSMYAFNNISQTCHNSCTMSFDNKEISNSVFVKYLWSVDTSMLFIA